MPRAARADRAVRVAGDLATAAGVQPGGAQALPAEALHQGDRRAAHVRAAAPGRRGDHPHRSADVLPRLLRRPPGLGRDRLHARSVGAAGTGARPATRPSRRCETLAAPPRAPLRHDRRSARARPARSSPTASPRRGGACWCSSAARTSTRASSPTTRSTSTCCLYNEGALQLATNFSLQVLQGMCVGGGTTINNALCLAPPGPVLDDWAQRGLDRAGLETAIGEIREWLDVSRIRDEVTTIAAAALRARRRRAGPAGRGRADGGRTSRRPASAPATATSAAPTGASRRRSTSILPPRAADATGSTCSPTCEVERDRPRRRPRRRRRRPHARRRAFAVDGRRDRRGRRPDRVELAAAAQRRRRRRRSARGCTSTSTRR